MKKLVHIDLGKMYREKKRKSMGDAIDPVFNRDPAVESEAVEKLGYSVEQVKRKTITEISKELQQQARQGSDTAASLRSVLKSPAAGSVRRGMSVSFEDASLFQPNDEHDDIQESSFTPSQSRIHQASSRKEEIEFEESLDEPLQSRTRQTRVPKTRSSSRKEEMEFQESLDHPLQSRIHQETRAPKTRLANGQEEEHRLRAPTARQPTRRAPVLKEEEQEEIINTDDDDNAVELFRIISAKRKFRRQLERDPDFSAQDLRDWDKSIERGQKRLEELMHTGSGDLDSRWERWSRREEKLQEMEQLGLLDEDLAMKWREKQMLTRKFLKSIEQDQ